MATKEYATSINVGNTEYPIRDTEAQATLAKTPIEQDSTDNEELLLADENGNVALSYRGGHIATKNFSTINFKMKPVILGLSSFSGSAWTADGTDKAYTTSVGNSNKLVYSGGSTFEDAFDIGFNVIPEGDTFEMGAGKFYSLAGGMITISKTSSASLVNMYTVTSADGTRNTTAVKSFTLETISFVSGREYHIDIKKRVLDRDIYIIKITDMSYGYSEELIYEFGSTDFRTWGTLGFYMISGDKMTISNFSFAYLNPDEIQLMIVGHSFVEGNSISTQKDKKFARLIAEKIGLNCVSIHGRGGGTTAELVSGIFQNEVELLGKPKYVLFVTGTNDGGDSATQSGAESLVKICSNLGITPIWMTVSPDLRSGTNLHSDINTWIESQDYYLDVTNAFYNEDGTINTSAYLSDNVHPTIATHQKIADMFMGKFGKLFTIKN